MFRLNTEVERLEVQYKEALQQQQSRYSLELNGIREQLQEAESRREIMEREVLESNELSSRPYLLVAL